MKNIYPNVALGKFCRLLGVTRQAYYQHFLHKEQLAFEEGLIVAEILKIRKRHPYMGTRKLYKFMQPFLSEHRLKVGRDGLFGILSANHLLVRRRKKQTITTNSLHRFRKYSNLIKDFTPTSSNQLWVSDITYWKINSGFVYISFITDVYSRKIVGYHLADGLHTSGTIQALEMAIGALPKDDRGPRLIHHSDRGTQYFSYAYVQLLRSNNIAISMTENGDPLENAIAERINGIIKEEYLNAHKVKNIIKAKELLNATIELYNHERPHMSIGNHTPNQVHQGNLKTGRLWKNYYMKNPIIG